MRWCAWCGLLILLAIYFQLSGKEPGIDAIIILCFSGMALFLDYYKKER